MKHISTFLSNGFGFQIQPVRGVKGRGQKCDALVLCVIHWQGVIAVISEAGLTLTEGVTGN